MAWDDLCSVPFFRLDRLLVGYTEENPEQGRQEIQRLIKSYPSQRLAALSARTILLARKAAGTPNLARLDEVVAGLPEGEKGFLKETRRLREMVHEISHLQTRLDTAGRPFLREPVAELLCKEIEVFESRIGGFHEPLASEFHAAADRWLERARSQLRDVQAVLSREPTRQVFRAGDPVDRDGEAFVRRAGVVGELEQQVMLSTGCPGLVLYGRRRTGKSTVLRNLVGFLPPSVRIAGLPMQDPRASGSLPGLAAHLDRTIRESLPDPLEATAEATDLGGLIALLEDADQSLDATGERLILAVDEYELIDRKIREGVFPEDLLATVRESIQTHRRLIWAFAGSHEITELEGAAWTSYLVSARTVEVPPFTPEETRLLLTEPLKHSTLWPKDDPSRPLFEPGFWGEDGIGRVHAEAGGWPHLVQLIAETLVDLLNDEGRERVEPDLYERALAKAIVRGHTVLYELLRGESTPAEWEYLEGFRSRESQPSPGDGGVGRSLRRRLLVAGEGGEWRLRVPLMARWLRERG